MVFYNIDSETRLNKNIEYLMLQEEYSSKENSLKDQVYLSKILVVE